ncbi:MAG: arsenate reductase ArsC [Nitrospirales bacterium]|nr:arsenate reductase ArsC [Nitrospirales bacterium]
MEKSPQKTVVFVCVGNACRSQMSEGIARHLAGDQWEAYSAGSMPAGFVAQEAVDTMKARGIDISGQYSKGVDELPVQDFDLVVTMGCGDSCPTLKAKERLDWPIPDPIGREPEFFEEVARDLEKRIRRLLLGEAESPIS